MNKKFRIFYYTMMAIMILVLVYNAYLFISVLFGLPEHAPNFVYIP